jgi:hypothetical protein
MGGVTAVFLLKKLGHQNGCRPNRNQKDRKSSFDSSWHRYEWLFTIVPEKADFGVWSVSY